MIQVMYLVIIVLLCAITNEAGVDASNAERRLIRELFVNRDYNSIERPVLHDYEAVNVTFDLSLFQLIKIDEKSQTMEVSVWVRQKWMDSQLIWDPSEFNGIKEFNIPPTKVWLPDIVLYNNVHEENTFNANTDRLTTPVIVYHTGVMYWMVSVIMKSACLIQVKEFPFDTQDCHLKFGSWTHDLYRLDIRNVSNNINVANYHENNEWHLRKTEATRNEIKYECCPDKYPDVTFHIHVARRSLYYVLNLCFPITIITLLTTLVFVLPAESGERISLAVTLMLAVTVFMLLVAETAPATSTAVPLVSLYFMLSMLAMFIMIVLLCFINNLHYKQARDGPMGKWTRRIILDKLSYIMGIQSRECRHFNTSTHNDESMQLKENPNIIEDSQKNSTSDEPANGKNILNGDLGVHGEEMKKLDIIIKKLQLNDEEREFKGEYRIVARTMERCLFILFLIVCVLTAIGCFSLTSYVS